MNEKSSACLEELHQGATEWRERMDFSHAATILRYYTVTWCCGALYLLFWFLPTQSTYMYYTLKHFKTHNDEMQEQPTLQHSTKLYHNQLKNYILDYNSGIPTNKKHYANIFHILILWLRRVND
jgi:hypothetical protein